MVPFFGDSNCWILLCDSEIYFISSYHQFSRNSPLIRKSSRDKIGLRKEKKLSRPESDLPFRKFEKERITMSSKNNNQLNIPQAREAMDKFKMQAASEVGVNL